MAPTFYDTLTPIFLPLFLAVISRGYFGHLFWPPNLAIHFGRLFSLLFRARYAVTNNASSHAPKYAMQAMYPKANCRRATAASLVSTDLAL
jgi:hypothetical protein